MGIKHGTLFIVPFTDNRAVIGRYTKLSLVQVFNYQFGKDEVLPTDYSFLKDTEILFSVPVGFMRCKWKKIGILEECTESEYKFYMVSPLKKIGKKSYIDRNSFQIHEEEIINGEKHVSIRDSNLEECIGLEKSTVYGENHIERRVKYLFLGQDEYGLGADFYSDFEPLQKDSWFLYIPEEEN